MANGFISRNGWVLNFDAAPFANGDLHMGHARNYVLGDIHARWLRSLGVQCHYRSAFDAFGLPNEQGAVRAGLDPGEFVRRNESRIASQLRSLGLSYDGPLHSYADPGYYRWTQWLFVRMWEAGWIRLMRVRVDYCDQCRTVVSSNQAEGGACWRCGSEVSGREAVVWVVDATERVRELADTIDTLERWSSRARALLRTATANVDGAGRGWVISRGLSWGTPLPVVSCVSCGTAPVHVEALPVLHESHGGRRSAPCRGCGLPAPTVEETLDCFFDDSWCFFAATSDWAPGEANPFEVWSRDPPAEVHFHAGFDTYAYLPIYRLVSRYLHEAGLTRTVEPVTFYSGHDVVTAGGRKMSKRNGNVVAIEGLIGREGQSVVRLGVAGITNPAKPIDWSDERLSFARTAAAAARSLWESPASTSAVDMATLEADMNRFLTEYRVAAALDRLFVVTKAYLSETNGRAGDAGKDTASRLKDWWSIFAPAIARESTPRTG